jgi:LmbE family N-acetylglucosaminyl deacetylase
VTPDFSPATRLLVVAPHPDDETIATGGLIQAVRAAGGRVDVLLVTDGDNNPWPQRWLERRLFIDEKARRRWGERRRGEVADALGRLGVPAENMAALGWPDMEVTAFLRRDHAVALSAFAAVIETKAPTLIAIPALGDRHPDHGVCHVIARLAMAKLGCTATCVDYMVHGPIDPAPAFTLDMHAGASATKRDALFAHATQTALSRGRMLRMALRPERYGQAAPADAAGQVLHLPWRPSAWWMDRLRLTVVDRHASRVLPWSATREGADGSRLLDLSAAPAAGPVFVKLSAEIRSPWIFDRWGWAAPRWHALLESTRMTPESP